VLVLPQPPLPAEPVTLSLAAEAQLPPKEPKWNG
jgi:hypothetical protein